MWCSNCHAEDVNCTLITSEDQLVDGGLYFITYVYKLSSKSYYHTLNYNIQYETIDSLYFFSSNSLSDKTYPSISSTLINNTTIFKIVKNNGHWMMINTGNQKYVGCVTETYAGKQEAYNLFLHSKYPNQNFYITFVDNNLQFDEGRYFTHYKGSANYRIISSKATNEQAILLYRLNDNSYGKYINASGDLPSTTYTGNITFDRTYYDGYYNTLVLPFNVSNYKEVFGKSTTVYKLASTTDNSISFNKISDEETIEANRPYLINGTFFKSPYIIMNAQINYDGVNTITTTAGNITFNGVYKATDISNTNAFILHKDAFYICANANNVNVSPYKWYITTTGGTQAKLLIIDGEDAATGIKQVTEKMENKDIYNLQGVKIQTDWNSLPKGIYIVNNKKKVRK